MVCLNSKNIDFFNQGSVYNQHEVDVRYIFPIECHWYHINISNATTWNELH